MNHSIEGLLAGHPFFADLPPPYLNLIVGCARNMRLDADQFLGRTGEAADEFYLIRAGRVAVQTAVPGRGGVTLQTMREGDIAGWSWLFPPYQWTFDLKVAEPGLAIAMNGRCLRQKCDDDPRLGYTLIQRFSRIMTERLRATRLQLLDVYGNHAGAAK